MPKNALNKEVSTKQIKVRIAIRPFVRTFTLAVAVIRLEMIKGKISIFNIRINNSPGQEIKIIASGLRLNGRKPNPEIRTNYRVTDNCAYSIAETSFVFYNIK